MLSYGKHIKQIRKCVREAIKLAGALSPDLEVEVQ